MAEFISLCALEDIPDGKREVFEIDGLWVAVFNVGGKIYAIEDRCTHDDGTLTEDAQGRAVPLDGYEIECPRHGARFDIRNGKVLSAPAMTDIRWFEVRIQDGEIQLAF